ncbi:hypothetical protein [Hyphobacterium sp.]|uniref:hypothetical protein n=1 Tax=Hyphobacterium sp. TaxID=2004662 RepID=UPI003749CE43
MRFVFVIMGIAFALIGFSPVFGQAQIYTAMGPTVRTQVPGEPRTAVLAMINDSLVDATNCQVTGPNNGASVFEYFFVEIDANQQFINQGVVNAPFSIPAGATRYAVVSWNLLANFGAAPDIIGTAMHVVCDNAATAGRNFFSSLGLVQLPGTPADVISVIVTPTMNGVLAVTTDGTAQRAGVAMINIGSNGAAEPITVTPTYRFVSNLIMPFGSLGSPFELLVCETDPITGICNAPLASSVTTNIGPSDATFSLALRDTLSHGARLLPDMARVGLEFRDASGNRVGDANIAYSTPSPDASAATISEFAGIYTLISGSDDGQLWNGTSDRGDGWAIIDPNGDFWIFWYINSARIDPASSATAFQLNLSMEGSLVLGAAGNNPRPVSASFTGQSRHVAGITATHAPFEGALSGNAAPGGFFVGNFTRTVGDTSNVAISSWPGPTRLRANFDAQSLLPLTLSDLAGDYHTTQFLVGGQSASDTVFATITPAGDATGEFTYNPAGDLTNGTETCIFDLDLVQPDPALNLLRTTGTVTGCSIAGTVRGYSAAHFFRNIFAGGQRNDYEAFTVMLRSDATGDFATFTTYRNP